MSLSSFKPLDLDLLFFLTLAAGIALELELDNELVGAANSLRAYTPATERDLREPPGAMIQYP